MFVVCCLLACWRSEVEVEGRRSTEECGARWRRPRRKKAEDGGWRGGLYRWNEIRAASRMQVCLGACGCCRTIAWKESEELGRTRRAGLFGFLLHITHILVYTWFVCVFCVRVLRPSRHLKRIPICPFCPFTISDDEKIYNYPSGGINFIWTRSLARFSNSFSTHVPVLPVAVREVLQCVPQQKKRTHAAGACWAQARLRR